MADEGVSAYSIPLFNRPNGQKILRLREGDHVIISRTDRCFRSVLDFAKVMPILQARGITLHPMDAPFDPTTANGRAMMSMLVVFAQWESDVKSERTKAALAIRRAQGLTIVGRRLGFKLVRKDGDKYLVPDWGERALMIEIAEMRDHQKLKFREIMVLIRKWAMTDKNVKCLGQPWREFAINWTADRVLHMYQRWKRIIQEERLDTAQIQQALAEQCRICKEVKEREAAMTCDKVSVRT
jgi:DNA invertase Pin-like site-specific DNA recombinase